MEPKTLIAQLQSNNYEARSYSGRGMFGKSCVSVNLDDYEALWELAQALASSGYYIGCPKRDTMGKGIVAYWPQAQWPAYAD